MSFIPPGTPPQIMHNSHRQSHHIKTGILFMQQQINTSPLYPTREKGNCNLYEYLFYPRKYSQSYNPGVRCRLCWKISSKHLNSPPWIPQMTGYLYLSVSLNQSHKIISDEKDVSCVHSALRLKKQFLAPGLASWGVVVAVIENYHNLCNSYKT